MSQYDLLRAILSDRPVAFHPELARLLGGIHEALFFQQIAYWSGKGDDPEWIYKTQAEMEQETALNRYQQDKARATLKALGVLREERRGLPARLWYQIDWDRVISLVPNPKLQIVDGAQSSSGAVSSTDRAPSAHKTADGARTSKRTTKMTKEETAEWIKMAKRSKLDRLA